MPLQIDATLCYAKGGAAGARRRRPTDKIDSPYNTYKVAGLPPTPIRTVQRGGAEGRVGTGTGAVQVLRVGREREARSQSRAANTRNRGSATSARASS